MNGDAFLIKINYRAEGNTDQLIPDKTRITCSKEQGGKYLIGGGIYSKNGGTIFFKARSLQEAHHIANNNLLTKERNHKYEEVKRHMFLLPHQVIK